MADMKTLKETLLSGGYDSVLKEVYLYDDCLAQQRKRYADVIDSFINLFGADRIGGLYSAPGRTEIGGNHTDHNHGRVLAAGIDLDAIAVASKNTDHTVRVKSAGYRMDVVDLSDLSVQEKETGHSAALVRGVCARFQQLGYRIGGFDATTASRVLSGSGLSSSAAFEVLKTQTAQELTKNLSAIWADVKVLAHPAPITVSTSPQEEPDKGLLNRLLDAVRPNHIHVAFINERNPVDSTWTSAHDLGRQYLEQALAGRVTVRTYNMVQPGENAETVMEQAIAEGAQVLFATTPPLIAACRKIAVRHPGVRILNCSVSMPYTGVRTYYSRIYEGKFITGAIAGAMAKDDQVGYVASYPIFGVPAGINAFALGARLANPRVKIYLHWSCTPGNALDLFTRQGISIISNRDIPTPDLPQQDWGVYQVGPGGAIQPLASPYWHWGRFYEKMIRSILNGGWDALNAEHSEQAVNYWWGMSSGVVDVRIDPSLPDGVQHLAEILKRGIVDGSIDPFHRLISSQDGALRNDGNQWYSPEEILHMDWLCDCVEGSIPTFDQLLPMSQAMVRLQGVYRDRIPPEKEGTLL